MPLPEDTLSEIDLHVRSGFDSRDRIIEIFTEEMYAPGDLDTDEVAAALDSAMRTHERSKIDWPTITDWDRLDLAFERLRSEGLICLRNAGYTQSDGYSDCMEQLHGYPDPRFIVGYCYYHGQDMERAVAGGGLLLAFGPIDPEQEKVAGPAVGASIVRALAAMDLEADWDGNFESRIGIPVFDWKKR